MTGAKNIIKLIFVAFVEAITAIIFLQSVIKEDLIARIKKINFNRINSKIEIIGAKFPNANRVTVLISAKFVTMRIAIIFQANVKLKEKMAILSKVVKLKT